jgi:hypothetical protein
MLSHFCVCNQCEVRQVENVAVETKGRLGVDNQEKAPSEKKEEKV